MPRVLFRSGSRLHRYLFNLSLNVLLMLYARVHASVHASVQSEISCGNRNFIDIYLVNTACCPISRIPIMTDKNIRRTISSFQDWKYAARQILHETFPIDPIRDNFVRKVTRALFSEVEPIPFRTRTKLVAVSTHALRDILDMDPAIASSDEFLGFVSGSYLHPGSTPMSHRYGGHQFGIWADQLGDGRAVMLGEYVNTAGERWELQLKGSGHTPYSRRGDGRAVLRSSVREFLCSEAMQHLGIPTSRAAALVVSEDTVVRDQFYSGHPRTEFGAVVLRLAQTWFRFGSLELLAHEGEITLLKQLTDHVIKTHFPRITETGGSKYLAFFSEVVRATAEMIAKWQSVGFTHGVCNTDNFSLVSITIDYGPFGFLDEYNPEFVPNTSDDEGMYSYEKQPDIGAYNLDKLRLALLPLLKDVEKRHMHTVLKGYADLYKSDFMRLYRQKLGLLTPESDDEQLIAILLKMMQDTASDFTMTFRHLGEMELSDLSSSNIDAKYWAVNTLRQHEWFGRWIKLYGDRIKRSRTVESVRQNMMNRVNPRYILRNWIAQHAISLAEKDDFREVQTVLRVLQHPFTKQPEAEERGFAQPPPKWAKSLKVSCSS